MSIFQSLARLGLACVLVTGASAQTSNPDNTTEQAAQAQIATSVGPTPSPTAPIEPPSLIPPNILPPSGTSDLPKSPIAPGLELLNSFFKNSSLGKAADEQRLVVETARLQEQIRNDPELAAEKARANRAPTDLQKRLELKTYYHHYYQKLRALAGTPELKGYLDGQEVAHQAVLAQPRVRPDTNPAPKTSTKVALPKPIQAKAEQGIVKPP